MHSSITKFPPELIDAITEHLSDDSDALKSCCLVSSIFAHSSRARLFRSVEISSRKRPQNLVKMSPNMISNIRWINIFGSPWTKGTWLNHDGELPQTLGALIRDGSCQVQTVSLRFIHWQHISSDIRTPLQKLLACKSIVHVRFLSCYIPNTIFDHVSSRLMTLDMDDCRILQSTDNVSGPVDVAGPDIILKSLKLGVIGPSFRSLSFMSRKDKLGRRVDITRLRRLSLITHTHQPLLELLIKKASPSIEQLTLAITPPMLRENFSLDLSQLPHLEYLTLLPADDIFLDNLVKWLTTSLKYLNAENLLKSITVILRNRTEAHSHTWRELDSLLDKPPFESGQFRGLIFKQLVEDVTDTDFVAKFLPLNLPRIDAKGLLQVRKPQD